jgi:hypothetical protein
MKTCLARPFVTKDSKVNETTHPGHVTVQRMLVDTQTLAHLSAHLSFGLVRLVIGGEVQIV